MSNIFIVISSTEPRHWDNFNANIGFLNRSEPFLWLRNKIFTLQIFPQTYDVLISVQITT